MESSPKALFLSTFTDVHSVNTLQTVGCITEKGTGLYNLLFNIPQTDM